MKRLFVTMLVALSLGIAPAATAAEDSTCTLPIKPHWCVG